MLVEGRTVACLIETTDVYGRSVAVCMVDGKDVGELMVRSGWALDFRRYSKGAYAAAEAQAREAKRGMWAGSFVEPWNWRRARSRSMGR